MQGVLEDLTDPGYPSFIKSPRDGSERRLHQPLGWAAKLGRVRIEHYAPVVPASGPPPDVARILVKPLQLSPSGVRQTIHAFAVVRF